MLSMLLFSGQAILALTIGILIFNLFVLSVVSAAVRGRPGVAPTSGRRFAVLIPAYNEESTIGPTLESILSADYPRALFDVFVIADNCTDTTARVSRDLGARVLERRDLDLRGKGYALRWAMDLLLASQERYDAFIVVDADSTASANFLGIMNASLDNGASVIQANDIVKPQPGAWSSEITRLGFTLYNFVRPRGRSVLGLSAGLRGNGMCFAAGVLRSFPWEAYSRAEDLEFGLHLLLHGVSITFAPEATVLATMPVEAKLAESQRARWEAGRIPVIRRFAWPLLKKGVLKGSWVCIDALLDLLTPALVNLTALVILLLSINVALPAAGVTGGPLFVVVWTGLFIVGLLHVVIGLFAAHADGALYKALLHIPRYALWKLLLYAKLARREETKEWIRTTREISP